MYLRERPPEAPSDPWDQPVIPEHDLGERLPDIEWREVRVVVWVGILAVVALAWLGPWSDVRHAIEHVQLGWVVVAVVLVGLTYPLAAGGVVAATDGPDGSRRPFLPVLATAVASSFTGRLLPEYGPAGLAVHQLVRSGQDRRTALDRLTALDSVSPWCTGSCSSSWASSRSARITPPATRSAGSGPCGWRCSSAVVIGLVDAPRRYATLVVRPDRRSLARLWTHDRATRSDWPGMVASALALALVNGLVVLAAVRAFGADGPAASGAAGRAARAGRRGGRPDARRRRSGRGAAWCSV